MKCWPAWTRILHSRRIILRSCSAKLVADPQLGVVGTPYKDTTGDTYDYRFVSTDHVSGACQVFRRTCFEQIGGYVPSRGGCIDTIATLTARSKGWKTRTFAEKISLHHRVIGTAEQGQIRSRFILGRRDWAIGNHPLWEACRGLYQMTKKPYVLRGFAILAGYAAQRLAAANGRSRESCARSGARKKWRNWRASSISARGKRMPPPLRAERSPPVERIYALAICRMRRNRTPMATVILNADDWGIRVAATDRILDCLMRRSISSTSAMVFMADSERAADAGPATQHRCGTASESHGAFHRGKNSGRAGGSPEADRGIFARRTGLRR